MANQRVALVNVYGDDNRGSCALTWAALDQIRRLHPAAEVAIVAIHDPAERSGRFRFTARRYPDVAVLPPPVEAARGRLSGLRTLLRVARALVGPGRVRSESATWLASADLVVSRGGVVLQQVDRGPGAFASFLLRMTPLLLAVRLRRPVVLYGAHIGPFNSSGARRVMRWLLGRVAFAFPRDSGSLATLVGLRPGCPHEVVPDSVFSLRLDEPGTDVPSLEGALVVSPSGHLGDAARGRQEVLADVARRALSEGLVERVVVSVQVHGDAASDLPAAQEFADLFDPPLETVGAELSPFDLVGAYGSARAVVGFRLHACVLALVGGTPALPLHNGLQDKSEPVFREVGLGHLVPPTDATADEVFELLKEVLADGGSTHREVADATAAARERCDAAASSIAALTAPVRR